MCYQRIIYFLVLLLVGMGAVAAWAQDLPLDAERRATLAEAMDYALDDELLAVWYPRVIDHEHGGYLSGFDAEWEPQGPQNKMIVTQARHVWTTARAALFYPADPTYLPAAAHGIEFLRDVMWDDEEGGFFWMVTREGEVVPEQDGRIIKQAYGNAFGIYALAAYFDASGDSAALDLAQRAFHWLDDHAHDPVHGGYFQFMERDGTPLREGVGRTPPKDQNSSIHILEAFTDLYHVWPDERLGERLHEMLTLIRDTITTDTGYLTLFSTADWQPISYRDSTDAVREANIYYDHVSFGHDVETAYLMLEAAEALGVEHDRTLMAGKRMVDHALRTGWDDAAGGFYDAGYYFDEAGDLTILRDTKNWWAQAEGLNTLLLMGDYFPDDPLAYHMKFLKQWDYVQTYLIDHEHGGWYEGGLDKEPEREKGPKAHIWKGAYHDARALMNSIRRLRAGIAFEPVNENASDEARALLRYLYAIDDEHLLAGQHNYNGTMNQFTEQVHEMTGAYPALWGTDFIWRGPHDPGQEIVDEAIKKHEAGYLVTLMWHAGRPTDEPPFPWSESIQGELTDAEWRDLTTPGTALHARWQAQADTVASYLKQLRDAGVPVLWRPYHEMNGVWFWWGDKKGEDGFVKLWRMMFDRYVHHHNLTNLLWVWNANAPRDIPKDQAFDYEHFYPGHAYVDILATDVYHFDYEQKDYNQLLDLADGRVIALGEVGQLPKPEILEAQPRWAWFMVWSQWLVTHNPPGRVEAVYAYPPTLTHDEVDLFGGHE